jgi:hypothetical protein
MLDTFKLKLILKTQNNKKHKILMSISNIYIVCDLVNLYICIPLKKRRNDKDYAAG